MEFKDELAFDPTNISKDIIVTTPQGTVKLEEYKKELFEVKEPAYKVFELPRLDTIDSHDTINTFPIEGVEGRLYIDHSTGNNYIWVLNQYKPIIIVTDLHRR